jgi:hypothetical protein
MNEIQRIQSCALELCEAIRRHARLCCSVPDDDITLEIAAEDLAAAVTRYADVILKERHATTLFESSGADSLDDQDSADSYAEEVAAGDKVFVVDDCYTIRILDPRELSRFVNSKYGMLAKASGEALRILCEKDGWDVSSYPEGALSIDSRNVRTA